MKYKLKFEQKSTYLHITITGMNNRENTERYLEEIFNECKERKCYRVLIEEHLDGPLLRMTDVFEVISGISTKALGSMEKIAYVDVNMDSDARKFAETVAVNRSLPVTVFSTVADAEKSLLDDDPSGTKPKRR